MRGNAARNRRLRPLIAGVVAFLLLLAALYCLDRAGGHIGASDVFAALAAVMIAGAVVA